MSTDVELPNEPQKEGKIARIRRLYSNVNFGYLVTIKGLLKMCEAFCASLCTTILTRYCLPYATSIGESYFMFATAVFLSLTTTVTLLCCCILSVKTYHAIRQTLFVSVFF